MTEALSPVAAGFGLGIALAGAPGPVQAVLLGEALRGGISRGFSAMAGANLTFGVLLLAAALGLSLAPPSGVALAALKVLGGAFLLWLAVEGWRAAPDTGPSPSRRRELPPVTRGALAVLLNPGGWLFLGTAASSLLSTAAQQGGRRAALYCAFALFGGLVLGDGTLVLLGGTGLRRPGPAGRWVRRGLALVLAGLGTWVLADGVREIG